MQTMQGCNCKRDVGDAVDVCMGQWDVDEGVNVDYVGDVKNVGHVNTCNVDEMKRNLAAWNKPSQELREQ